MTGFTHLFNAMRPLGSREPGPIAAALETSAVWFGMIVDGIHVDPAMLRLALRGQARPMLVTDAMPPVGGAKSKFLLHGQDVRVQGGACVGKDDTLSGTALTMADAVRNCVDLLECPPYGGLALRVRGTGRLSWPRPCARTAQARLSGRHGRSSSRRYSCPDDVGRRLYARCRAVSVGDQDRTWSPRRSACGHATCAACLASQLAGNQCRSVEPAADTASSTP